MDRVLGQPVLPPHLSHAHSRKVLTAMVLGLVAVLVLFAIGAVTATQVFRRDSARV